MGVPKFKYFYLSSLNFFRDNKIHTKREISEYNAKYFNLDENDKQEKTGKGNELKYKDRTNWAINHMFYANLLDKVKHGEYIITKEGQKVLEKNLDVIDDKFLSQYESFRKYRNQDNKVNIESIDQNNKKNKNNSINSLLKKSCHQLKD